MTNKKIGRGKMLKLKGSSSEVSLDLDKDGRRNRALSKGGTGPLIVAAKHFKAGLSEAAKQALLSGLNAAAKQGRLEAEVGLEDRQGHLFDKRGEDPECFNIGESLHGHPRSAMVLHVEWRKPRSRCNCGGHMHNCAGNSCSPPFTFSAFRASNTIKRIGMPLLSACSEPWHSCPCVSRMPVPNAAT